MKGGGRDRIGRESSRSRNEKSGRSSVSTRRDRVSGRCSSSTLWTTMICATTTIGIVFTEMGECLAPPTTTTTTTTTTKDDHWSDRRRWLRDCVVCTTSVGGAGASLGFPDPAVAASAFENGGALPRSLRGFTALAPLGPAATTSDDDDDDSTTSNSNKRTGLSPAAIASQLARDLTAGARGRGGYFVSGDLDPSLFRDDCLFVDPTNAVRSLSRYRRALDILFDPARSTVDLVEAPRVVATTSADDDVVAIEATVRSSGVLQLPWRPVVAPYESRIRYELDADTGLIREQSQVWNITAAEALRRTFLTTSLLDDDGATTAPRCVLPKPADEPPAVSALIDATNGRRPGSYSPKERNRIDALIRDVVDDAAGVRAWRPDALPGTWRLVYLQPGPDGGGVDRRIPLFPDDLPFNNDYQIFAAADDDDRSTTTTAMTIRNVGELLGPALRVDVRGCLREDRPGDLAVPKRFVADVTNGRLCAGRPDVDAVAKGAVVEDVDEERSCVPLPIRGEGLFDGAYLGERLRIGRNLNGGGARVVQLKMNAAVDGARPPP